MKSCRIICKLNRIPWDVKILLCTPGEVVHWVWKLKENKKSTWHWIPGLLPGSYFLHHGWRIWDDREFNSGNCHKGVINLQVECSVVFKNQLILITMGAAAWVSSHNHLAKIEIEKFFLPSLLLPFCLSICLSFLPPSVSVTFMSFLSLSPSLPCIFSKQNAKYYTSI